jgi:hypothetical protein
MPGREFSAARGVTTSGLGDSPGPFRLELRGPITMSVTAYHLDRFLRPWPLP